MGKLLDTEFVDISLEGSKLVVSGEYNHEYFNVNLGVGVPIAAILEVLKEKIPGTIDDMIIDKIIDSLGE